MLAMAVAEVMLTAVSPEETIHPQNGFHLAPALGPLSGPELMLVFQLHCVEASRREVVNINSKLAGFFLLDFVRDG